MKLPIAPLIHLLHSTSSASLATHATQLTGYPFASALPFALDHAHCPLLLISRLAEHTRNLQADPRASLLLCDASDDLLSGARLTLLGDFTPVAAENALSERYLRYHPDAERYLELGDFSFYRMQPQRARFIGGFGQMGWIEGDAWAGLPHLTPAQEAELLRQLQPQLPADCRLLGLDCFGIDLLRQQRRLRLRFTDACADVQQLAVTAQALLRASDN